MIIGRKIASGAILGFLLAIVSLLRSDHVSASQASDGANGPARAVVGRYCVGCHNEKLKAGGLVLENIDLEQRSPAAAALREKLAHKVRVGAMPPARAPRPDVSVLNGFAGHLEAINDADAKAAPNPGRPVIHRLNRAEYVNAVRDLLGIEVDGKSLLPPDDSSYGFDNVADVLDVSPSLLDRYLLVARKISRIAVHDATLRPDLATYKLKSSLAQDDRMSDDLPFGTRGGLLVRHHFPVDAEYEFRIVLQRNSINNGNSVRGLNQNARIYVLLDGQAVREVRIDKYAMPTQSVFEQATVLRDYDDSVEARLRFRLPVKAGAHQVGVTFDRRLWYVEGVGVSRLPLTSFHYDAGRTTAPEYGKIDLELGELHIFGPLEGVAPLPAHDSAVLSCSAAAGPGSEACAQETLTRLARLAYRRPLTVDDKSLLMSFYRQGRAKGTHVDGLRAGVERILVSPYFLFRKEEDPSNAARGVVVRVSDLDLASRLSFFLWSSIPDDELLRIATNGQLRDQAVLQRQVRRMLQDERSKAFLSNFFGQWLYLRNLTTHQPDPVLYPLFNDSLREAFRQETDLFLETQVKEDRSAIDLFTADYTFVNERLADFYGIPGISGSRMRRVSLPVNGPRAGLLGQGSLLTVTSYANRTSPVVRGKWLLENVLGNAPPPPPANVPALPENDKGDTPKSVRARMELHRRNPVCATCHSQIDPLGFALENFDAVGQYRAADNEAAVDASGSLPDGTTFRGPADFRQVLLAKKNQIMTTITEKLLTYALGRGIEYDDQPAVRQIVRAADAQDYRWSAIVTELVKSVPFQMRRSE